MESNSSYISQLAECLGAQEQALRLLMSLLLGYPLLYIHQLFLRKSSSSLQHSYFIGCGLFIAIYNYGFSVFHSLVCVLVTWLNLYYIGGTKISVILSFLFQMGYLITGYYLTGTETYDIKWTMPHCVLTLRLIALTYDYFDGQRPMDKLSSDQQLTALKKRPKLIEIASQTYFPASFLVGPQFSMRRYQDFIKGTLFPADVKKPVCTGILRGLLGLMYLMMYQIGSHYVPTQYLISEEFQASSFMMKCIVLGFWGKIILFKYVSCWLIAEGICIMCGLAYSGKDESDQPIWKGCANIKVVRFETGITFVQLVSGFNTNTNYWVVQYIYKRLRFLKNRLISQFSALAFLAIWHGLHSGYYITFSWEFLIMNFEKSLYDEISKYPKIVTALKKKPLYYVVITVMKIYTLVIMGYSLGPFALLKSKWWWDFYVSLYFFGHVTFGLWLLYVPLARIGLRKINNVCFPEEDSDKRKTE